MKVQFRSILFALVLPAAACGGDRDTSVQTTQSDPFKWEPKTQLPVEKPAHVEETPKPIAEIPVPVPTKYDEALALGRELLAKQKYGDAKEMLEAAIKLDKKKAEPHIEMARMYIALGERGKSIASAKQAIKLAPLSSQAWNTKGRAELNAHNYDNAIEAFSKAVDLNQDNVFAWNNLGYTELLLKQYEDAAEHLAEATSRSGATAYMFNNLGTALEHLDRLDDARTAYDAGGKLGSKEAAASRKRLEGVKTIAIASVDDGSSATGEIESKGGEYELTDEGDITDEDEQMEMKGSGASEEVETDSTTDEVDEKIDESSAAVPEVVEPVEPEVVEPDAVEPAFVE